MFKANWFILLFLVIVTAKLVKGGDWHNWNKHKGHCKLYDEKECRRKCQDNDHNYFDNYECGEHPDNSNWCCRKKGYTVRSGCHKNLQTCKDKCSKTCWEYVDDGWVCYRCESALHAGIIAGIVIGAIVLIVVIAVVSCYCCMCCPWYVTRHPVMAEPMMYGPPPPMMMPPPPVAMVPMYA